MSSSQDAAAQLKELAALVGIEESYWDIYGAFHETPAEAQRAILAAMGIDVATPAALAAAHRHYHGAPWQSVLNKVYVVRSDGHRPLPVDMVLPESTDRTIGWVVRLESGGQRSGAEAARDLTPVDGRKSDGTRWIRRTLKLPGDLPLGYHHLQIDTGEGLAETSLIVAPDRAYRPPALERGEKLWGTAAHVYALRRAGDGGIGDFTALAQMAAFTGQMGGDVVGVNPLHVLFPGDPMRSSPYSPSNRLFTNPLYLDVTAEPEYTALAEQFPMPPESDAAVDYVAVAQAKWPALRGLYDAFRANHGPGSPRHRALQAFRQRSGDKLQRYGVFEVLQAHFAGTPWNEWPEIYQSPGTDAVAAFAATHAQEVEFHIYLQWLSEQQIARVAGICAQQGMAIGLYRDLAVGVNC